PPRSTLFPYPTLFQSAFRFCALPRGPCEPAKSRLRTGLPGRIARPTSRLSIVSWDRTLAAGEAAQTEDLHQRNVHVQDPQTADSAAQVGVVPIQTPLRGERKEEAAVPEFGPREDHQKHPQLHAEYDEDERHGDVIPAIAAGPRGGGGVRHRAASSSANRSSCAPADGSKSAGNRERARTGSKLRRCKGVGPYSSRAFACSGVK